MFFVVILLIWLNSIVVLSHHTTYVRQRPDISRNNLRVFLMGIERVEWVVEHATFSVEPTPSIIEELDHIKQNANAKIHSQETWNEWQSELKIKSIMSGEVEALSYPMETSKYFCDLKFIALGGFFAIFKRDKIRVIWNQLSFSLDLIEEGKKCSSSSSHAHHSVNLLNCSLLSRPCVIWNWP